MPLMGLAYLGFISLGLPDGLHGVAWPSMSAGFGVPLGAVGYVFAMGTTGYVLSSVTAGFLLARLGVGILLAGSTALSGLGLTGYAISPNLVFVMGAALVLGLGSGAIDSGLNAYAAAHFSSRHMNWLHASFGFGAMMGPLVMTGVLSASLSWRWGYGVVAVALACLSLAFTASRRAWQDGNPAVATATGPRVGSSLRIPAVWLGVATFGVYTGLEIAAGLWAYTMLTDARGLAPATAGICVSAYWGALFAGRLLLGAIGDRITPDRALWAATIGFGLGALMLIPPYAALSVAGLILIGFAAAPVFPDAHPHHRATGRPAPRRPRGRPADGLGRPVRHADTRPCRGSHPALRRRGPRPSTGRHHCHLHRPTPDARGERTRSVPTLRRTYSFLQAPRSGGGGCAGRACGAMR